MPEEPDLHYFKLFYQKINNSTIGWKDDEFGAYVRLLIRQFDKGSIPDDPEELSRLITSYKKNWVRIGKKFKPTEIPGELRNDFMGTVRDKALKKSAQNSENGKEGGRGKRKADGINSESEIKANALRNESHTTGLLVSGSDVLKSEEGVRQPIIQAMTDFWRGLKPEYPFDNLADGSALFEIGEFISSLLKIHWLPESQQDYHQAIDTWKALANWVVADDFYKSFSLAYMAKTKTLQTIWQKSKEVKNGASIIKNGSGNRKSAGAEELADQLAGKLAARRAGGPGG